MTQEKLFQNVNLFEESEIKQIVVHVGPSVLMRQMSVRICIASGQTDQRRVSSQNLLACCSACGFGCDGGYPAYAWIYWKNTGITLVDYQEIKRLAKHIFCLHVTII